MRLFCGLSLAYEVRRNIELLLQHLKPLASINWSPPENLHITTKFIGEWPDTDIGKVKDQLAELPKPGALKITVGGLGWYPNPHHPRIFFAGVIAPELSAFAQATDQVLASIGVKQESKPYNPHLTLARIKADSDLSALRRAIAGLPSTDFGTFIATKHLLYRSQTGPKGSVYSVEAEFPLA